MVPKTRTQRVTVLTVLDVTVPPAFYDVEGLEMCAVANIRQVSPMLDTDVALRDVYVLHSYEVPDSQHNLQN